jgi:hypothetical protein
MNAYLYVVALSAHVVTAVVGLGCIVSIPVVLHPPLEPQHVASPVRRLVVLTHPVLVVMLLSGVLVDYASGAAFHEKLWFRASFLLLLTLGALNGWNGRTLKRMTPADGTSALAKIRRVAWVMCGVLTAIALLMAVKPG